MMSGESPLSADLLDLKLLPAWVKETEPKSYEHYSGDEGERPSRGRREGQGKRPPSREQGQRRGPKPGGDQAGRGRPQRDGFAGPNKGRRRDDSGRNRPGNQDRPHREHREQRPPPVPIEIGVRFLPRTPALDNVVDQIKSGSVVYSLFHLARLFLEKPQRYEVRLNAKAGSPLFQLGENGAVSLDRQLLEQGAFRLAQDDFYKVDVTQGEPIKGNFLSVARDPLSGMLLGPTNHHAYQPRLRTLYEQRFSRRMSFADYQRQIEIVNDPAMVERWKEEAQRVTTYSTVREETAATFSSAAEAERHFRAHYLPDLVRSAEEMAIGGVQSRQSPDRALHRAIEDAWAAEMRSPSNIMQALAAGFRDAGLIIFRHRRGMLFVSPIRIRPLVHEQAGVSASVNSILQSVAARPGIGRKELADKLIIDLPADEGESRKRALAADLHWLISEGYVIEFNDGSLDLPRSKTKSQESVASAEPAAEEAPVEDSKEETAQSASTSQPDTAGS